MPTLRKPVLVAAVVLAAASLTALGTMSSYASSPAGQAHSTTSGVVPNPDAPHVGRVVGAQYGSHISLHSAESARTFKLMHRDLIAKNGGAGAVQHDGITTIHPSDGTSFDVNDVGEQATQSVSTKIKPAQGSTTLYTPTTYPSAGGTPGSCVEVSTIYTEQEQAVGAWDWCVAINFEAQITINKSFIKTYTKRHFYSTQIVQTNASNNTWTAYLYNYKTNKWQTFFSQKGSSQIAPGYQGWDVYELYSELDGSGQSYACADLKNKTIEAKNIMVGVGGTMELADPTNAGTAYDHPNSDFDCNSFSYSMLKPLYHWRAIG